MGGLPYPWLEKVVSGISKGKNHKWTHDRPASDKYFLAIEQWYVSQVAYLTQRLKDLNVFDGTVVLWSTNEGRGFHEPGDEDGRTDLAFGIMNGGDVFKPGRVIAVAQPGHIAPEKAIHYPNNVLNAVAKTFGYAGGNLGTAYRSQGGATPYLTA